MVRYHLLRSLYGVGSALTRTRQLPESLVRSTLQGEKRLASPFMQCRDSHQPMGVDQGRRQSMGGGKEFGEVSRCLLVWFNPDQGFKGLRLRLHGRGKKQGVAVRFDAGCGVCGGAQLQLCSNYVLGSGSTTTRCDVEQ